jgi:hypothetical protein
VVNWYPDGTGTNVWVNCFALDGAAADAGFHLRYVLRPRPVLGGYVWANQAAATRRYTPSTFYNTHSVVCDDSVAHDTYAEPPHPTNGGEYLVTFPQFGWPDGERLLLLTPYGDTSNHCKIMSWFPFGEHGLDLRVKVDCYTSGGGHANSRFMLSYEQNADPLCLL